MPLPAVAHDTVDLAPVVQRIDDMLADPATPRKDYKAYKALRRAVAKANPKDLLSREIKKTVAVASAVHGKLAADQTLAALLETALDTASHDLGDFPEQLSLMLGDIVQQKTRDKLEAQALEGYGNWTTGRAGRADSLAAAKEFLKAAKTYEKVLAAAAKSVKKHGAAPRTIVPEPGRVYTLVGTGERGFNGDGLQARSTTLYFVDEIAFDLQGRLVILDWNNHMIRRLKDDGTVERLCGSGTPGDSEGDALDTDLNHPSGVAFDPDGRIYIAAWHNHKVKVYDPNGTTPIVYTIAGGPQGNAGADGTLATDSKYNLLPSLLRLPNGDLLTIDAGNQVIRHIALSNPVTATNIAGVTVQTGAIARFAGTTGQAGLEGDGGDKLAAKLSFSKAQDAEPDGRMTRDAAGNLYVLSSAANVVRKIDPAGVITTFAGNGTAGYSGDGGPATQAQLDGPADVAIGPDGNVYISDANNQVIRRVAPDGTISTHAGLAGTPGEPVDGATLAEARFHRPAGLEFDPNGNLLVADRYNNVVRVLTSSTPGDLQVPVAPYKLPLPERGVPPTKGDAGTIDTYAGSGTLGFNGDHKALDTNLYWPQDLVIDPSSGPNGGEVYFLDWNNHRVRKVASTGYVVTVVGSGELGSTTGPAAEVRLNHPTDLAFHPLDNALWIAGWHTDKILRLDPSENTIAFQAGGARSFAGDGGPASAALLNIPVSVKFDAAGNWYVSDEGNLRIRMVDAATNVINTIAGTGVADPANDNGPAALAGFAFQVGQSAQPSGRVALSPDDRFLYVADTDHHAVRRIDLQSPERTITSIAGDGTAGFSGDGGPATAAQLNAPVDVDCDAAGNVYVADRDNHAVRKVDVATGTISTIAGAGSEGYSGDKGPATAAHLRSPGGIFVVRDGAQAGRVYIADTYNGVLRVVWE
jgi:sugar lactone lactonase YvrE